MEQGTDLCCMQQAAGAAQEAEELSSQASSSEPPSPTAATEAPQELRHQHDHLQQLLDPGTLLAAGNAAGQKASGVIVRQHRWSKGRAQRP